MRSARPRPSASASPPPATARCAQQARPRNDRHGCRHGRLEIWAAPPDARLMALMHAAAVLHCTNSAALRTVAFVSCRRVAALQAHLMPRAVDLHLRGVQ